MVAHNQVQTTLTPTKQRKKEKEMKKSQKAEQNSHYHKWPHFIAITTITTKGAYLKAYDTHMSTNKQTNKQMCVMIKVILGACEWQ